MKTILATIGISFTLLIYGFTVYELPAKQTVSAAPANTETSNTITGAALFIKNCAACHRADLSGNPPAFPSLKEVKTRMTKEQIINLLKTGRNNMPSFAWLSDTERKALTGFLYGENTESPLQTQISPEKIGRNLFVANCARCHKAKHSDPTPTNRRGMGMHPPVLAGVTRYLDIPSFETVLNMGSCYMPSFDFLSHQQKSSIYLYLKTLEKYAQQRNGMMRMGGMGCGGNRR